MGIPGDVIKKEGILSSESYRLYVMTNMEHPAWVSRALQAGQGEFERQPGQWTNFG